MSVRKLELIMDNTLGMEKQVNSICKSCYYQIRNIGLISKYINDEICKTGLWQCFVIYYPPLSDKLPMVSAELSCTSGDMHSQKGIYNGSFVLAAQASCTFQINKQDPVSRYCFQCNWHISRYVFQFFKCNCNLFRYTTKVAEYQIYDYFKYSYM